MNSLESRRLRRARPEEVIDLRHRVLRLGLPRESAIFPGDDSTGTVHLATIDAGGAIVGCATMIHSAWEEHPAWQVRGMAVDPAVQGTGVGRSLLHELERIARDAAEAQRMWCNAREGAVGFYERQGWTVASPRFVIATAGPHFKMTRKL